MIAEYSWSHLLAAGNRWRSTFGRGLVLGVVSAAALATTQASAATWQDQPYPYAVADHEVMDVLQDFGRNLGLPLHVGNEISGTVHLPYRERTARGFLDAVAADHRLVWYFDGHVLHIATAAETATRLMPLEGADASALVGRLAQLELADERFPIRRSDDGTVVMVSGPPVFLDLVQSVLDTLKTDAVPTVFRGTSRPASVTTTEISDP